MKKQIIPALLVILPFFAMAQFSITGKVTNKTTNEILLGANIRILDSYYAAVSNNSGMYELKNLKQGTYYVVSSYVGFNSDTILINLTKNSIINIQLIPASIMQEEVIVYATRAGKNTPIAHQNIDKKSISATNFGQDLPVLIGNSISTVSSSDAGNGMGYTALRIRGTDMTRINVTINGLPLNDPESHNVFWVDLPDFASSTDNIQIQRGVGTSTNGASAFGASINLQSSHLKTEPYAELHSAFGSFNTFKNTVSFGSGLLNKHFSMDGRISKLSSDGFIDRATSDLFSYYISGAYTSNKNLLRFNIISGKEKTYQAWDGVPSNVLDTNRTYNGVGSYTDNYGVQKYYSNETDNYLQTHYQALFSHQFNSRLFLNLSAHHTLGAGYYEQYREDDDLEDYGMDVIKLNSNSYSIGEIVFQTTDSLISSSDLIRQKHLANTYTGLVWSLNFQSTKFKSSVGGSYNVYSGNHFGKVIWAQFTGNSELGHEWYRSEATKNDFNFFAKTEYTIVPKVNIWGDIQLRRIYYSIDGIDDDLRDITQNHTFNFINPKAGVSVELTDNQQIYTSLAIANREPNRDNFVDADPTKPLPQSERLYDLEAGYSISVSRLAINANVYYMYYHNQLVLTGAINDVGAPIMINVPRSFRSGIEISAKALLKSNIKWEPSFTLSNNKLDKFTEYVDNWDTWEQLSVEHTNTDLSFSPKLIANNSLSFLLTKELTIQLISKYVSKQYLDNTQSSDRQLDSYFVNNVLVNYVMKTRTVKEIGFSFMLNNVFNVEYETNAWVYRYNYKGTYQKMDGYFPQAGINFMLGMQIKL